MALTLVEAAKLHTGDVFRSAIIEMYAMSTDILRVLPFEDIAGNALRYNREETLPGIGFRGVNEAYTESTGILNPMTEPLVIAGGDLDVDTFILKTQGMDQRTTHERMKIKALALNWTKQFIKGDSDSDPRVFDGLQKRISGNQKVTQVTATGTTTAAGDPLSLYMLDSLIDAVDEPTHLLMNKTLARRLSASTRATGVSGYIVWSKDEFGRRIMMYNDLPILIADKDNTGAQILPFTEPADNDSAAKTTSIYCLSLNEGMLTGIQNDPLSARDIGELQTKPALRSRIEWFNGIAAYHGRCAARLWNIEDAAVIAG